MTEALGAASLTGLLRNSGRTENGNYSMVTSENRYLDLANPQPEDISIKDIAGGLSRICRFAGQCPKFYSVAQHSVNCVALAQREKIDDMDFLLAVLMHDAAEAYVGDISRPLKMLVPGFKEVERRVQEVIWSRFAIQCEHRNGMIKLIDNAILFAEKRAFFPEIREKWHGEEENHLQFEINKTCFEPQFAEAHFAQMFQLLTMKAERR